MEQINGWIIFKKNIFLIKLSESSKNLWGSHKNFVFQITFFILSSIFQDVKRPKLLIGLSDHILLEFIQTKRQSLQLVPLCTQPTDDKTSLIIIFNSKKFLRLKLKKLIFYLKK